MAQASKVQRFNLAMEAIYLFTPRLIPGSSTWRQATLAVSEAGSSHPKWTGPVPDKALDHLGAA